MPRPAYIILANSGAVDLLSNAVSMFDVVEMYLPGGTPESNLKHLRMVAVWLKEEGDGPTELFEGQLACVAPDGSELFVGECDDFTFSEPFFRWNTELAVPEFTQSGTHIIEARLRRAGEQEWTWWQTFSFLVQAQEIPEQGVAPEVPQSAVKEPDLSDKLHRTANATASPEEAHSDDVGALAANQKLNEPYREGWDDVEALAMWMWDAARTPEERKFLRELARTTMRNVDRGSIYLLVDAEGKCVLDEQGKPKFEYDGEPDDLQMKDILGRFNSTLDGMDRESGPEPLRIPISQAVSLLLGLGFKNAKRWSEKGDIKTITEKINALGPGVIGKDQIKKLKGNMELCELLVKVLEAIKANEEFVEKARATLQIEVRAE